jgi:hypothetical protein
VTGSSALKRFCAAATIVAATASLAACGGSSHTSSTSTTKTKNKAPGKPVKPASVPSAIVLAVRPAKPGAAFSSSLKVVPGDQVQVRAVLPPALGTKTVKVKMDFAAGPGDTLNMSARAQGHTASAAIYSANGKPVTLELVHFSCLLPPAPTICPPLKETDDSSGIHLVFATTRAAPVFVTGTIGPVPTKPAPPPASGSVVPPYTVSEQVKSVVPGSTSAGATFSTSASANPGELVVFATRLRSKLRGAGQTVTIKIHQGPGSMLTVSASVPGGPPSVATVKSASGSPISLVLPRYTCFAPPTPTFCPALKISSQAHRYTLQFSASPATPAIVIQALTQAG